MKNLLLKTQQEQIIESMEKQKVNTDQIKKRIKVNSYETEQVKQFIK
jgi:hypothetical protein